MSTKELPNALDRPSLPTPVVPWDMCPPHLIRSVYSISELSEGQRCLLSLYMILHFRIERGDTVFIDEPDNFIALREIQPWLLAAEEAVDNHHGQLIIVSHHPETLNQWTRLKALRCFREQNGQVRTVKFLPDGSELQPSEVIARGWE